VAPRQGGAGGLVREIPELVGLLGDLAGAEAGLAALARELGAQRALPARPALRFGMESRQA